MGKHWPLKWTSPQPNVIITIIHGYGMEFELATCDVIGKPLSSLVEGGEGSYLPNCQTNLVIALDALSLLFCIFINTTAYHLGRYEPSSPVSCRAPRVNVDHWDTTSAKFILSAIFPFASSSSFQTKRRSPFAKDVFAAFLKRLSQPSRTHSRPIPWGII